MIKSLRRKKTNNAQNYELPKFNFEIDTNWIEKIKVHIVFHGCP